MEGLKIKRVKKGSVAEELGLEKGDIIVKINDKEVEDLLEYNYLVEDEFIELTVMTKQGEMSTLNIEKDYDEEIGLEFDYDMMNNVKSCSNNCMFCFIDQMPEGMRDTLYFKDDDSKLSFLQGSFVTLTNMSYKDLDRVIDYRISPINISVHTTNPELRIKMLSNRFAGDIMEKIKYLTDGGIEVNCQIVLCKGINDGAELDRTINDLSAFYPMVQSVAVVPVGLTDFRDGLYKLEPFKKEASKAVVEQIEKHQEELFEKIGTRFVFPSDEFFIVGEKEIPSCEYYEEFPQIQNGVGLIASFYDEFMCEMASYLNSSPEEMEHNSHSCHHEDEEHDECCHHDHGAHIEKTISIATGVLAFDFMKMLAKEVMDRFPYVNVNVYCIKNEFFGSNITVSGLITGQDLVKQLTGEDLGEKLLISRSMLKQDEDIFLDDMRLTDAEDELSIKIKAVYDGGSLFHELALDENQEDK